jgi:hypothetical protein
VLVCSERKVLLAGCWWLICCERKVLLAVADKPSEQGAFVTNNSPFVFKKKFRFFPPFI